MINAQHFKFKTFSLMLILMFLFPFIANANTVNLPNGAVVVDNDNGVSVASDGVFFIDILDIYPGESFEKSISISNMDQNDFSMILDLSSVKHLRGPIDFSKEMMLSLALDGSVIYEGPLGGLDDAKELNLGVFNPGDEKELTASFSLGSHFTNDDFKEVSETQTVWIFKATQNIIEDEPVIATPDSKEPVVIEKEVPGSNSVIIKENVQEPVKNYSFLPQFGDGDGVVWVLSIIALILIGGIIYWMFYNKDGDAREK